MADERPMNAATGRLHAIFDRRVQPNSF